MSFTFSSYQALLLPMILVFGFLGYRRGAWKEIGITGGMALVVLLTVFFPQQFLGFINRIIINIPRVFGLLLGRTDVSPLPEDLIFGAPGNSQFLLARVVLFFLLAFLVYTGRYGWSRDAKTNSDRLLGLVLGGATGLLWFVGLNDFVSAFRDLRGGQPIPPEGQTVSVPIIDVAPLVALVPTIAVILLIVLVVLAIRRLPRLWSDGGGGGGGKK
jgi:hypothetical protein